jgi:hypothetical protein
MAQETLKKMMLTGAAAMFVLVAIAAFWSPSGAWPLCVGAIALMVLVNFDRIAKISASVTGAEIVMQQVENKVIEIRRVVIALARMNMATVQRSGRWDSGFTQAEGEAIKQEAEELMRGVGVDDAEIAKIRKEEWDRYVYFDYVVWASSGDEDRAPQDWERLQDMRNPGTPDKVETLLKRTEALTPERQSRIDLYRYYVQHGRHRDPVAWENRGKDP